MSAVDVVEVGGVRVATASDVAGPERVQLGLAVGVFIACFALYASVAGTMPTLAERLHLTERQVGVALAIPAFLGAFGRVILGIVADRIGGRKVLLGVMAGALVPGVMLGFVHSYAGLLACAFLLGVPLAVYSAGVTFVSNWYPAGRQGGALGMLGLGNMGQSVALFLAPMLVMRLGLGPAYWVFTAIVACWLVVFAVWAKDAPRQGAVLGLEEYIRPMGDRRTWVYGAFYFLTFGGVLAMTGYLPKFLTMLFSLSKEDAGLRAAGFVVVATLARPTGGWLADRVGGRRVLLWTFPAVAVLAVCMACPRMETFTVGALGMAVAIGLGNGAVFKLVAETFRGRVGGVTGVVGAGGALGGFFPPLLLGIVHDRFGSFTLGFVLLGVYAVVCWGVCGFGREVEGETDLSKPSIALMQGPL